MFIGISVGINKITKRPPSTPTAITLPTIAGLTVQGSTLTVTPGTWAGSPSPTLTHQWYADISPIIGQTALTYVTGAGNIGQAITCREIGTNTSGSATVSSNAIIVTA